MRAKSVQIQKAEAFRALHHGPPLLVLPNAWDLSSAKLFEKEGFKAMGTTSAGIAATLGYPDGQYITLHEMTEVVARIIAHTDLPVSADMEAGYSVDPEGVAASARAFLDAGAVGLNIEDSTGDASKPLFDESFQAERIRAVRETLTAEGIPLVLNARIDTYLFSDEKPETCLRQSIERANAFIRAGADCIFVPSPLDHPGLLQREDLVQLVREIDAPLNVLGGAVILPLSELEEIGVSRVSLGPGPMRTALALIRRIARELKQEGTFSLITSDTISYAEVNGWFL